jgi:hypothetical protein
MLGASHFRALGFVDSYHFASFSEANNQDTEKPAQAKPGRVGNADLPQWTGTTTRRNYCREANRISSVADTFCAVSSASALLFGRRYSVLLSWSLIPDRK